MTQLVTFFFEFECYKEPLTLRVYCYLTSYRKQHFAVHCNETVSPEVSLPTLIFNLQKYQQFLAYPKKQQKTKNNLSVSHYPQKYQDYTLQPMLLTKIGNQIVEFIKGDCLHK